MIGSQLIDSFNKLKSVHTLLILSPNWVNLYWSCITSFFYSKITFFFCHSKNFHHICSSETVTDWYPYRELRLMLMNYDGLFHVHTLAVLLMSVKWYIRHWRLPLPLHFCFRAEICNCFATRDMAAVFLPICETVTEWKSNSRHSQRACLRHPYRGRIR